MTLRHAMGVCTRGVTEQGRMLRAQRVWQSSPLPFRRWARSNEHRETSKPEVRYVFALPSPDRTAQKRSPHGEARTTGPLDETKGQG